MEVLASMNRMTESHSSHFTFLVKMALDCSCNTTGPAFIATQEFLVTYCLTFVFFILFVVPFRVHFIDISRRLLRLHIFTSIFVKTFCIWNIIIGLYQEAQLQYRNTPEDISDILGTRAFQRYVDTPLQTLDGIIVNQPKHFLPLAKEAKRIAKGIRIEKINEQWAGIPREQLLNQSFNDQLNSIQILKQLAPLQLAKEHLPGDIVDILERLCKADNIPFNQLYYIAKNCADCYYSKVIETFVALLKCQFAFVALLKCQFVD